MSVRRRSRTGAVTKTSVRRGTKALAGLAAVALALGACGDDDDDASAPVTEVESTEAADDTVAASTTAAPTEVTDGAPEPTAGSETTAEPAADTTEPEALEPVDPLKITVGSRSEGYGPIWIALGDNLFEKHGVEVEVVSYSGIQTGLAQLVSDQIDIFLFTPFIGLQAIQEGTDLVFFYDHTDLSYQSSTFIAAPEITSFDDLAAMGSDCRIATTSIGTAPYYFAKRYLEVYDLGCEIVPQASIDLQVPAIASGEVEAASVVNAVGFAAESEGLANLLYDPRAVSEEEGLALLPEAYPLLLSMGKRDVLEEKREAVVRYVAALQEAAEIIASSTPEELAEITLRVEPWAGIELDALTTGWTLAQPQIPSGEDARIEADEWERSLNGVVEWGIENIDPANADLGYDAAVDMSYFDAALERG